MSAALYPMNMFKVKPEIIPGWIYKYQFRKYFENEDEYYKEISRMGGVDVDKRERIFLTLIKQPENRDVELLEKLKFEKLDLHITKREQLIAKYLKRDKNIKALLNKSIRNVRKEAKFGNFLIKPRIETEVKYYKNFYLIVDFRHRITSAVNLWEYVGKDKERLKKYIGKKLEFSLNPERTYTIKEIREPNADEARDIIRYVKSEGFIDNERKLEETYGKIDYSQPIIYCEEISHPFLPQLSALVFNLEELEGTEEAARLQAYWRLSNEKKLEIIRQTVENISDIVDTELATFEFEKLIPNDLLVKNPKGESISIKETYRLFRKAKICLPYEVPDFMKNSEIPTFILIDSEIPEIQKVRKLIIEELFERYNGIRKHGAPELPYFDFAGKTYEFNRNSLHKVIKKIREVMKKIREEISPHNKKISFALIVGKEIYPENDYYEDLKRQLFQLKIISQNVVWDTLKEDEKGYAKNNLLIQIMGKLGIKYFVLDRKIDHDYILGVDVGKGMYGRHRIAGCTVIFDSEGKIQKIVPVKVDASGETIDLPRIIEYLQNKTLIEFRGKKILLLRDGKLQYKEREDLIDLSKDLGISITFMNVKKNHNYKIGTDNYGLAISFGDLGILLPHTTRWGATPLKIDTKFYFENGNVNTSKITIADLQLLYDLTRLNYSTLFSEKLSFRLPAPIHYADKFIKASGKGWEIDEDLLSEGCLYFI
ncbi:hypothetical protein M1N80_03365 [Peptococcaceae bacterium]|nr:hypothetical protein [Peptococcaceae bacterium]